MLTEPRTPASAKHTDVMMQGRGVSRKYRTSLQESWSESFTPCCRVPNACRALMQHFYLHLLLCGVKVCLCGFWIWISDKLHLETSINNSERSCSCKCLQSRLFKPKIAVVNKFTQSVLTLLKFDMSLKVTPSGDFIPRLETLTSETSFMLCCKSRLLWLIAAFIRNLVSPFLDELVASFFLA